MNSKNPPENVLSSGGASRMSAESVLKDKILRKESDLNALQILQKVIVWDELSDEDESKLWSYFCRSNTI